MKISRLSLVAILSTIAILHVEAIQIPAIKMYENENCRGKPTFAVFNSDKSCDDYPLDQCMESDGNSFAVSCADSYKPFTDALFGNTPYMLWELYETNCTNLDIALVYIVDGKCHTFTDWGIKVTLNANNSITVLQTTDNTCSHLDQINSVSWNLPRSVINTDECSEEYGRVYSNAEIGSNITTGNSSIAAASFVAPIFAILLLVVAQTLFAL